MDLTALDKAEHEYRLNRHDGYSHLVRRFVPGNQTDFIYEPSILTLAAGIASRLPDRGPARSWSQELLPWPDAGRKTPAEPAFYSRPVPAHVHWGGPGQKRVFIIFGSSYSTWKRGTWTNLTVEFLNTQFHEPHLIVFAGFLTPEFLDLRSSHPAVSTAEPARDLYCRLEAALAEWKRSGRLDEDAQVGLIGFSGGASLVVSLLAEDARRGDSRLFRGGGIAFSPVLDLPRSCEVLDGANKILNDRGFPPGRALTTPIFPDALLALLRGYSPSNPAPFLRLTATGAPPALAARKLEMVGRFYREFQRVDLATVAGATYPQTPSFSEAAERAREAGQLNYRQYYERIVFDGLHPGGDFEKEGSLQSDLARISRAPCYVVFAQDDPVLSRIDPVLTGDEPKFSPRLAEVLEFSRRSGNVRVFNPRHGAHLGYFLDQEYLHGVFTGFFAD